MEVWLGSTGVVLTVVAIVIACMIFTKENQQLRKLAVIGGETQQVAEALEANKQLRDAVNRFFELDQTKNRRYKCVYPETFKRRPLPSIYEGDYHAVQVLVGLLGQEHLEFCGVTDQDDISQSLLRGDLIYLCTPMSNAALQKRYPYVELLKDTKLDKTALDALGLPCWFAKTEDEVKKIVFSFNDEAGEVVSPADEAYRQAALLPEGVRYRADSDVQRDYGIVAKITDNETKTKTIVIAGIHQYGTWIAAEFFDRLLRSKEAISYRSVLEGSDDFCVIVWGSFSHPTLRVKDTGVHENYIWRRLDGQWSPPPRSSEWGRRSGS